MRRTIHGDENGMCVLEDGVNCSDCGECDKCDLNEKKICDNCGACIDQYNTNEKGFVEIPIEKIDLTGVDVPLEEFYKMMGLEDDDDDDDFDNYSN